MLEELYEKFYTPLERFCLSLTRERAAAEDIAQDTFIRAMANLDTLAELSEPQQKAWLFKTAKNLFIDSARRAAKAREDEGEPMYSDDHTRIMVSALMSRLPESERGVFALRHFAGYNASEIGDMLDLPPSTVRARLASARRKLKAMYFDE